MSIMTIGRIRINLIALVSNLIDIHQNNLEDIKEQELKEVQ